MDEDVKKYAKDIYPIVVEYERTAQTWKEEGKILYQDSLWVPYKKDDPRIQSVLGTMEDLRFRIGNQWHFAEKLVPPESLHSLHHDFVEGLRLQKEGFETLKEAILTSDPSLREEADTKYQQGTALINRVTAQLGEFMNS